MCLFYIQYPALQWSEVFRKFDFPEFYIPDVYGFLLLADFWRLATLGTPFPLEILFADYRNTRGHLSLLSAALAAPVEVVNFLNSARTQRPLEGFPAQVSVKGPGYSNQAWCSLDLIDSLLHLSESSDLYLKVRSLMKVIS